MTHFFRPLVGLLVLMLAGCLQPPLPGALTGPLPPQPPGATRLVFYRSLDYYATTAWSAVYLNGQPTGISQPNAVFYRDVAPGRYDVVIQSPRAAPNQSRTLVTRPGEVFYVRIDTLPKTPCDRFNSSECIDDTFVLTIVDPAVGPQEIQGLRFISG